MLLFFIFHIVYFDHIICTAGCSCRNAVAFWNFGWICLYKFITCSIVIRCIHSGYIYACSIHDPLGISYRCFCISQFAIFVVLYCVTYTMLLFFIFHIVYFDHIVTLTKFSRYIHGRILITCFLLIIIMS